MATEKDWFEKFLDKYWKLLLPAMFTCGGLFFIISNYQTIQLENQIIKNGIEVDGNVLDIIKYRPHKSKSDAYKLKIRFPINDGSALHEMEVGVSEEYAKCTQINRIIKVKYLRENLDSVIIDNQPLLSAATQYMGYIFLGFGIVLAIVLFIVTLLMKRKNKMAANISADDSPS